MTTKPFLEIDNLTVSYPHGEPAVDHAGFTMAKSEIVVVAGESGSGKSTLIRAVIGLLPGGGRITEGRILCQGLDLTRLPPRQLRALRGRTIALAFQDARSSLDPKRKIGSQFTESLRSHRLLSAAEARRMALRVLADMHLPDPGRIMNSYTFELSGGMCQRIALAMAISEYAKPDILLADEPTSTLDVMLQAQVIRQMLSYRERFGTSIILVTHNFGVAAYMADTIVVMRKGRIVESGSRDQVILDPQHDYTKSLLAAVPTMKAAGSA
ncbi:MAG: ABC transporter ATP-binding protein [Clostridiales bacterium]|nr:ABC transporter ATP-binding protein [Clostridiales bacterium]